MNESLVEVSPDMIRRGVETLLEERFSTPHEEIVSLVFMAMEYQRRREVASRTKS